MKTVDRVATLLHSILTPNSTELPKPDDTLDMLGADSLDQAEIYAAAEETFGIKLDDYDDEVTGETTVEELAVYIGRKLVDQEKNLTDDK